MASFMRIKATVRRYVASISHLHRAAGLANPCNDELVPRLGANPRRTGIVLVVPFGEVQGGANEKKPDPTQIMSSGTRARQNK